MSRGGERGQRIQQVLEVGVRRTGRKGKLRKNAKEKRGRCAWSRLKKVNESLGRSKDEPVGRPVQEKDFLRGGEKLPESPKPNHRKREKLSEKFGNIG